MEDVLQERVVPGQARPKTSRNPCFNGRCTPRNMGRALMSVMFIVVILVLMEDVLQDS